MVNSRWNVLNLPKWVALLVAICVACTVAAVMTFVMDWRFRDPFGIAPAFSASGSFVMFCLWAFVGLRIVVVPLVRDLRAWQADGRQAPDAKR